MRDMILLLKKNNLYLDGFQYAGKVLQFFPHAEGYIKATSLSLIPGNPPTAYQVVYQRCCLQKLELHTIEIQQLNHLI